MRKKRKKKTRPVSRLSLRSITLSLQAARLLTQHRRATSRIINRRTQIRKCARAA